MCHCAWPHHDRSATHAPCDDVARRAPTLRRAATLVALLLSLLAVARAEAAGGVRLEHLGRYNHQLVGRDHLVGVLPFRGHYGLTCSYDALRVIDLAALPSGNGGGSFLSELRGHDVYSLVNVDDTYVYAHLRLGGFGVVRIDPATFAIQWIRTLAEPGVYYEAMTLVGDRLYVAAHAHGIRVYDVTHKDDPLLLGSLTEGFVDAFAIAVADRTAYVADGAGGLKVVDVTHPSAMRIMGSEGADAIGTSEDVAIVGDDVYVAAGSEGVLSYEHGDLPARKQFQTPGIAKALAKVGPYLAVADITGMVLMKPVERAALVTMTSERGLHRMLPPSTLTLRLWHGVASWGDDRVVAANWDAVDVYRLVPVDQSTQPDGTLSDQRLRFPVVGGTIDVTLSNPSHATLQVTSIASSAANFTVAPSAPFSLAAGAKKTLSLTYAPGAATQAIIKLQTNDPDEATLPIEAFGDTAFVDPGDDAPPFTLPRWTWSPKTGTFLYDTFSLAEQEGKVVYFQVFGTWCPACLPVIADVQTALGSRFADHPQVQLAIMSQKESAALMQEYWTNIHLELPLLFDLAGVTAGTVYGQPYSGLPFSRSFLVGPDQVAKETWFGFNADRVVDAIRHELIRIAIPGDANLDGMVDGDDAQQVLADWGLCDDPSFCPSDQNGDGFVDGFDLGVVRRNFGAVAR